MWKNQLRNIFIATSSTGWAKKVIQVQIMIPIQPFKINETDFTKIFPTFLRIKTRMQFLCRPTLHMLLLQPALCYLDIKGVEMMIMWSNVCVATARVDTSRTLDLASSLEWPYHYTIQPPVDYIHLTIIAAYRQVATITETTVNQKCQTFHSTPF